MPEPTPIDTALWRATSVWSRHDRSVICDEVIAVLCVVRSWMEARRAR